MKNERNKQGVRTGLIGLICNLLLGGGKLVTGLLTGSVSLISDAANNLSDAGSSALTVTSFALGNRAADRGHPYGHGRYEYIAGLLIGVIVIIVGVELITSSIEKIVRPVAVAYGAAAIAVMAASVAVKLGMGVMYRVRARKIGSDTLRAAAFDSFSDCIVTGGLLLAVFVNRYVAYPLEGPVGLVISLIIVLGGFKLVLGTINRLLGVSDPETGRKLKAIVLSDPMIVGTHDLRVHDYGPNCQIASIHAEFEHDISITDAHEVIDRLERRAADELGVELVIHCDPLAGSDVTLNRLRRAVWEVTRLYSDVGVHDLEIDYNAHAVSMHLSLPDKDRSNGRLPEMLEGAVLSVVGEGYEVRIFEEVG